MGKLTNFKSFIIPAEINFYKKILNELNIVFDVGSARDLIFYELKKNIELHLFEPYNFRNIRYGNIYMNKFGLGNFTGKTSYYPDTGSIYKRKIKGKISTCKPISIDIKKLDDYCLDKNISHIDLLKIDTEGYELEILKGGKQTIDNCKYIQFEYGGTYQDAKIKLRDVIKLLSNRRIYKLTEHGLLEQKNIVEDYRYANFIAK